MIFFQSKSNDGVKNQKPITQFFKCLPNSCQNLPSAPLISESSEELISSKRKTTSPVSVQLIINSDGSNCGSDSLRWEGKSKKCKTGKSLDKGPLDYESSVNIEKGCNKYVKLKNPLSPQNAKCVKDDNFNPTKESPYLSLKEKENHVQIITNHKADNNCVKISPGKNKLKCDKSPRKGAIGMKQNIYL